MLLNRGKEALELHRMFGLILWVSWGASLAGSATASANAITVPNLSHIPSGGLKISQGDSVAIVDLSLLMQSDGNLVLYQGSTPLWSSGTGGNNCENDKCQAIFQSDGNLVVYDGATPLWSSQTGGNPTAQLALSATAPFIEVQNAGSSVLWNSDAPCSAASELVFGLNQARSTGAISLYYDPTQPQGNLIEPYFANYFFMDSLNANQSDAALNSAAGNWINWYLNHANYEIRSADGAMLLMNGAVVPYPTQYYPDPSTPSKLYTYTASQMVAVKQNFSILHKPGTIYKYYVTSAGEEVPSFNYFFPPMDMASFSNSASQQLAEMYVYDSTDSYGATFASLVNLYFKTLSASAASTYFQQIHWRLKTILNSSFMTLDPSTGLTIASPAAGSEYGMDNVEVWKGIVDYIALLQGLIAKNPSMRTVMYDGFYLDDEITYYSALALDFQNNIWIRLQYPNHAGLDPLNYPQNDTGLYEPGLNAANLSFLTYTDPSGWWNLSSFDAGLLMIMLNFPLANPGVLGMYNSQVVDKTFYRFKQFQPAYTQAVTVDADPNFPSVWRMIPFAQQMGRVANAKSQAELSQYASTVCSLNVAHRKRAYPYWDIFESGSYIRLKSLLGEQ